MGRSSSFLPTSACTSDQRSFPPNKKWCCIWFAALLVIAALVHTFHDIVLGDASTAPQQQRTAAALPCPAAVAASLPCPYRNSEPEPAQQMPAAPRKPADNIGGISFDEEQLLGAVDIVYTWVNGSDSRLSAELAFWKGETQLSSNCSNGTNGTNGTANGTVLVELDNVTVASEAAEAEIGDKKNEAGTDRFRDNDELRCCVGGW